MESVVSEYQKKLWTSLEKGKKIDTKDFEHILDYFNGFVATFNSCYNSSLLVKNNETKLDTPEKIQDFLLSLASMVQALETTVPAETNTMELFLTGENLRESSEKMLELAPDSTALNKLASEVAYDILIKKVVQDAVLRGTEKQFDKFFNDRLDKLDTFCKGLGENYTEQIDSIRKGKEAPFKLGNNDASALIDFYLNSNLVKETIKREFVQIVVKGYKFNPDADQSDASSVRERRTNKVSPSDSQSKVRRNKSACKCM